MRAAATSRCGRRLADRPQSDETDLPGHDYKAGPALRHYSQGRFGTLCRVRYLTTAPDAAVPTETAVIAAIPEAEPLIGEHRQHLDAAAARGVPAHVTVLSPFVAPAAIDARVVGTLAAAVVAVSAFHCRFTHTDWFGEDVLWLAPEPAEPFRQLTAAVWGAFPQHPPYEGVHEEVVPHLTIAERRRGDLTAVRAAERAVQPGLPLSARIESVLLIAGTEASSSWRILHTLPLGA